MKPYVTFTDNAILEGVTPQQELLEGWTRESSPEETPPPPIHEEMTGTQAEELGAHPISQEADELDATEELDTPMQQEENMDEPAISMATVGGADWGARSPYATGSGGKRGRFPVTASPAGQR